MKVIKVQTGVIADVLHNFLQDSLLGPVTVLVVEMLVFRFCLDQVMNGRNRFLQFVLINRLGEIKINPVAHGGLRQLKITDTAQNNKFSFVSVFYGCLYNLNPGHFWHSDIHKYKIWFQTEYFFQCICSVGSSLAD